MVLHVVDLHIFVLQKQSKPVLCWLNKINCVTSGSNGCCGFFTMDVAFQIQHITDFLKRLCCVVTDAGENDRLSAVFFSDNQIFFCKHNLFCESHMVHYSQIVCRVAFWCGWISLRKRGTKTKRESASSLQETKRSPRSQDMCRRIIITNGTEKKCFNSCEKCTYKRTHCGVLPHHSTEIRVSSVKWTPDTTEHICVCSWQTNTETNVYHSLCIRWPKQ